MISMAWMWTTLRRFQGHLLQKDLLGLVAFPFVSYALCRFLQLHSYPCLNSHVWIVLLGNEQLVELSLELGNRLLPWISFLNPMMILGHDYERNINIYIESNWYTMVSQQYILYMLSTLCSRLGHPEPLGIYPTCLCSYELEERWTSIRRSCLLQLVRRQSRDFRSYYGKSPGPYVARLNSQFSH